METKVELLIDQLGRLQRETDANKRELEADLKRVKDEADADAKANAAGIAALEAERKKALIWGVTTLGTALLAMGSWLFTKAFSGEIKW